jgi:DNA-binding MarR family transcriptional regulator/GNAT superfamily N-acetyltransferase
MATPPVRDEDVAAVRRFNRFHTRLVGALNEHLLASDYTLPQSRILHEIACAPPADSLSARDLCERLRMDRGYLSRLVSGLEDEQLVRRTPTPENAKRLALNLTDKGWRVYAVLNAASAAEVAALLEPLSEAGRSALVGAMSRIQRILGDADAACSFVLREPRPGDLGYVIHRQAELYAREYGFDWTFEGLLSEIVGSFVRDFEPTRERCWIAEMEGDVVGSVFVVRQDDETAKLRMLYVDPCARGRGLGRSLVEECLGFARSCGYSRMRLWTNDCLIAARRIYQSSGFRMVEEEPHKSFGQDLVGQIWERDL